MFRLPAIQIIATVCVFISGCTSERQVSLKRDPDDKRDVMIEVILETDDPTISIDVVEFFAAESLMSSSMTGRPPKTHADGSFNLRHTIDSPYGNFVIVELVQNEQAYRSEIFKLDPELLSKASYESEWLKPSYFSFADDELHWRLRNEPGSFSKPDNAIEFCTELRLTVTKP